MIMGVETSTRRGPMETFCKLFGSLLAFVYHCFDRIVIHGYLSGLSRPEQVVYFFRDVIGVPVVDKAVLTPDGPVRQALYDQLQLIFYNDCPSFPLGNPRGRFWCQYWVKGWYYDAMYPAPFYYTMWKWDNPWYDSSGSTPGISDRVVAMKDIAYLIAHFNAKAPVPGLPTDPKWVGTYGANGCVDPFGDRTCNMKDIAGAIQNFNAHGGSGHP
jgi:hypothetical protein